MPAPGHQTTNAATPWNIHCNYHRPHSGVDGQPPAARLNEGVTNVVASYNWVLHGRTTLLGYQDSNLN